MNTPVQLDEHRLLCERKKELSCVYEISRVAASDLEGEAALKPIAQALVKALQIPDLGLCRIRSDETEVVCDIHGPLPDDTRIKRASGQKTTSEREGLYMELIYERPVPGGFLIEETALLNSTADISTGILAKSRWIRELREAGDRLASKNAALRELIDLIEQERQETAHLTESKIQRSALPLVQKLRSAGISQESREAFADALIHELSRVSRPYALETKATTAPASLSPREREIIKLLRLGQSSREIAAVLALSAATVERHRHNIRKKLGLVGSDANLVGMLMDSDAL